MAIGNCQILTTYLKNKYVVIASYSKLVTYSSADIMRNLNMKTEIQNYIRKEMKSTHEEKKKKIGDAKSDGSSEISDRGQFVAYFMIILCFFLKKKIQYF